MSTRIGLAALVVAVVGAGPQDPARREPVPVLVELFTSEGCSSCPPADSLVARLLEEQPVAGERIIALGEHVDYWDDLGWKDRFSSHVFTERQEAYVRRLGLASPYTPQVVAGGRFQALGSDTAAVRAAVEAAAGSSAGSITLRVPEGTRAVEIDARWKGTGEAAVLLAIVQEHATSDVTHGENAGRSLQHVSVVRSLSVLGSGAGHFTGHYPVDGLRSLGATRVVVFVQEPRGGPVRAVETLALR